MNTMKKILAFAMVVSMVLGCFVISTSAAEKKEIVKDGLIAWYDGSNNYNGEQNKTADLWKDLSGNANHIDVSGPVTRGEVTWQDNCLTFNEGGAYLRLPTSVVEALETGIYTIEIVTGELVNEAQSWITLLSSPNDELSVFIRVHEEYAPGQEKQFQLEFKNRDANKDENRPQIANAWDKFNSKTLSITSDLSIEVDVDDTSNDMQDNPDQTANIFMYSDALQVGKGKSEYTMSLDGYAYLGHNNPMRAWSGDIYAVRIYEKALTPEEVAQNVEADQYNYRQGNTFAPTQEYDPELDKNYEGFKPLPEGLTAWQVPFTADTDIIPLTGFHGSTNLFDYMYPLESDPEKWEGARLMMTEELETNPDGSTESAVKFKINYQTYLDRANLKGIPIQNYNFMVLKVIIKGNMTDFNINAIAFNPTTQEEEEYSTGSTFGGIDPDLDGEVQYLVYDFEDVFTETCDKVYRYVCTISGMDVNTEIYLLEMALFETEEQAEAYQNGTLTDYNPGEAGDSTGDAGNDEGGNDQGGNDQGGNDQGGNDQGGNDQGGNDQGGNDQGGNDQGGNDQGGNDQGGNDQGGNDQGGNDDGDTTTAKKDDATTAAPADEGGCASVVGFGAAAILVAAAAAVVLKKKD